MDSLIDFPKHPNRVPGFSMGYKYEREYSTLVPGPGTYNPSGTLYKSKSIKFPGAKRMPDPEPLSPGPGAYDISSPSSTLSRIGSLNNTLKSNHSRTRSFPKANRFLDLSKTENQIGPGAYDIPDTIVKKKNKSSASLKHVLSQSSIPNNSTKTTFDKGTPGPGSYYLPSKPFSIHSVSGTFGKAPRDPFDVERLARGGLEGPLYYSHSHKSNLFEGPGVKFRQGKRRDLVITELKDVPGPGTYDVTKQRKDKSPHLKSTFGGAIKLEDPMLRIRREEPGPGEYPLPDKSFEKGVKFTTGSREHSPLHTQPGPGAYNIEDFLSPLRKSNSQKKHLDLMKRTSLKYLYSGPSMKIIEKLGNSISITDGESTSSGKPAGLNPHLVRFNKNLENFSQHTPSQRDSKGNTARKSIFDELIHQSSSPGPVYKVDVNSIEKTLGEVGMKFPSAPKLEGEMNHNPGPGTYDVANLPLNNRGGRFLQSERNDDSMVLPSARDVPGVGHYEYKGDKTRHGPIFGKASRWKEMAKPQLVTLSLPKSGLDEFFIA